MNITNNPMFGFLLCLFSFILASAINRKVSSPLANPLLISVILSVSVLLVFKIPFKHFEKGSSIIAFFLLPATASLGVNIYQVRQILLKNIFLILTGGLVASVTSIVSVLGLSKIIGLDAALIASSLPKSVTSAVSVELSGMLGGDPPVTIALVLFTGITGAIFGPIIINLLNIKDPVVKGMSMGASSHTLGTSEAIKMGEIEGAISSVAIAIVALITTIIILLLKNYLKTLLV